MGSEDPILGSVVIGMPNRGGLCGADEAMNPMMLKRWEWLEFLRGCANREQLFWTGNHICLDKTESNCIHETVTTTLRGINMNYTLEFNDIKVRTAWIDGDLWLAMKDVARLVRFSNPRHMVQGLGDSACEQR
jgi:hypothetical protein